MIKYIFVWTPSDLFGLILLGIVVLIALGLFLAYCWGRFKAFINKQFKKKNNG